MKKPQPLPEGLQRIKVPAEVARKVEARLDALTQAQTALAIAQQGLRTACDVALTYEGIAGDGLGIAGVESGPDVYTIIVRKAPKPTKEERIPSRTPPDGP